MKLGIVGTGQIAEEVLSQLGDWGWTAEALCGTPRSEEKVRQLCAAYNIPLACTDYSAMLKEADVDAIYIVAPNFLHYSLTKQALEASHHVILERPRERRLCRNAQTAYVLLCSHLMLWST